MDPFAGPDRFLEVTADALAAGFAPKGRTAKPVRGAVALALDFWPWRRLAGEGMSDDDAAALMVAAVSMQFTVRPLLLRVISPASDSTSRCFMIAGSDTGNGWASSLTVRFSFCSSRATSARRVGSASAENTRSSASF